MNKLVDLVNLKVVPCIDDKTKQIDIVLITEITIALINLFRECKNLRQDLDSDSVKVMRTINNPNFINKARLYLTVRRQCRNNNTLQYFDTIVQSLLKAGKTATKEDVKTVIDAI